MVVTKRPRWYFSLRSPYSWFAYHDLAAHYPDVLDAIEWIPQWEPDEVSSRMLAERNVQMHGTPMSRAKHFYILQDARRLARDRGLNVVWPVDRDPCWEMSHLAYLVAAAEGKGRPFVDIAYRLRWQHSMNLSETSVIAEIAEEIGLPAEPLCAAVDDPAIRQQGIQCLVSGYRDGVFGVPFFVNGRERFWGVERLAAFASSLREDRASERAEPLWQDGRAAPTPVAAVAGPDCGHAGGCG